MLEKQLIFVFITLGFCLIKKFGENGNRIFKYLQEKSQLTFEEELITTYSNKQLVYV
jgi:hypothetical protein